MVGRLGLVLAAVAMLGLTSGQASAMVMRSGPSGRVSQDETIEDDLYVAAAMVSVEGRVRGDLVAAGTTVSQRGRVDGDLLVAAGTLDISGAVGATVRAVGGNVALRGPVGADLVVAGGTVIIEPAARVARDLAAAGGSVVLLGTVNRNVQAYGGRVEIGGTVNGNVLARGTDVVILSSAQIRGNLIYSSEHPAQIASGARIAGTVAQVPHPFRPAPSREALRGFRVAFAALDFFWMLIIALVLVAIAPGGVQTATDVMRGRFGASLGWGLAWLVFAPVGILAILVTLVGIPIGLLLVMAYLLTVAGGHTAAALFAGQTVAPRLESRFAGVALGVAIVAIASNIPFIGWLLRLIAAAAGFGAVVLALWARRVPATPSGPPRRAG